VDNVHFIVRLYKARDFSSVVVEVQRRRGESFLFMRECRAIFRAAEGKSYRTEEKTSQLCIDLKSEAKEFVISESAIENEYRHVESLLNDQYEDTTILALGYLRDMADVTKSFHSIVQKVSGEVLNPSSSLCKTLLELLRSENVGDEQINDMAYKQQLVLNILANVLSFYRVRGELDIICQEQPAIPDTLCPILLKKIDSEMDTLHTSTLAIRCVRYMVDTSTDLQEKLIQAGLQNKVERAKDVGSIAHANLEKEAFAYLQCKS
jgi:hypothetical protein